MPVAHAPTPIDAAWVRTHLERNLNRVLNPAVCYQVLDALTQADSDFSRIAATLGGDPFIAAKVVGLATLQRRAGDPPITNIHRAVAVLGTRHVQTLVLAVMLTGPFVSADGNVPRRRELWRWVFACAAAGDYLGTRLGADDPEAGGFRPRLVGGLLLGLGPLILQAGLRERYTDVLGVTLRPFDLVERERAALGVSHHDVTLWALASMRCPPELGAEAQALRDADHETSYLRARAIEVLGARAVGLETPKAEAWLADALPRLGLPVEQLASDTLPALRARVRELTKVYDVDLGDWPTRQEARQRGLLLAGCRLEEQLRDEVGVEAGSLANPGGGAAPAVVECDSVTGLLTRRAWQAQLRDLDTTPYPMLGLLRLDLDAFDRFVDRVGHRESDRALGVVATVLRSTSREPILLGRFGRHEFVGLYDLDTTTDLADLSAQLRELLAAPEAQVAGKTLTACIGGVAVPGQRLHADWPGPFTRVTEALRRARQRGRSSVQLDIAGE